MIEVTSVKLTKKEYGAVTATASVVINNAICINNISLVETKGKRFISFPSRQISTGEFRDIVYPINSETREIIEKAIIEEYNK